MRNDECGVLNKKRTTSPEFESLKVVKSQVKEVGPTSTLRPDGMQVCLLQPHCLSDIHPLNFIRAAGDAQIAGDTEDFFDAGLFAESVGSM